jgi:hypothetical protein
LSKSNVELSLTQCFCQKVKPNLPIGDPGDAVRNNVLSAAVAALDDGGKAIYTARGDLLPE